MARTKRKRSTKRRRRAKARVDPRQIMQVPPGLSEALRLPPELREAVRLPPEVRETLEALRAHERRSVTPPPASNPPPALAVEAADTASGLGSVVWLGSGAATEVGDTAAGAGNVVWLASGAATDEAGDAAAGIGSVTARPVTTQRELLAVIIARLYPNGAPTYVRTAQVTRQVANAWPGECRARGLKFKEPSWDSVARVLGRRPD
jgi:hypothetical protein